MVANMTARKTTKSETESSESRLALLALVADDYEPEAVRINALSTLIGALPASHPYRHLSIGTLYGKLKRGWDCRPYLVNGRVQQWFVQRPPKCLEDVL
jgi:hypothetical protein